MVRLVRKLAVAAAVAVFSLCSMAAYAGNVSLDLVRVTLDNIDDAAGVYQQEGGTVLNTAGKTVGSYITTRRVTTGGTTALNTAATTVTLFFANPKGGAPNNVTLQGAHDFNSGAFTGSVSGASSNFAWLRDADATYTIPASGHTTVVMAWTGAAQLTVP